MMPQFDPEIGTRPRRMIPTCAYIASVIERMKWMTM